MNASTRSDAQFNGSATAALLDALFDNAPLGIAFLDREFRFVRINAALASMNGLSPEAHIGKTPRQILPGLPLDEIEAQWRHVLDTGEPLLNVEISGETPAQPGMRRYWREDWYPVLVRGEIIGLAAIVRDVTEQRRLDALRNVLVGIVGHDLRNPLSVVGSSATLLLKGKDLTPWQAGIIARIQRAVDRIAALARDLLDYTVIQRGGGMPVRPVPVEIDQLLRAAADEVQAAYPKVEIRVAGNGEHRAEWDPDRVQQIIGNLLSNAAKYGAADKPITCEWSGDAESVAVRVTNRGPVIAPERIPHLFDGVPRGDTEGRGGIGLGLFISREIVRAHGGELQVRSTASEGTTFTVRLPRRAKPFPA